MIRTVVIGGINWDTNLFVKRFPDEGEETVIRRITRVPGGKAGNTAVAAARLLGPRQVAILGGLGKDSIGTEQVKIFEDEGVVTSGLKFCDDTESGQAYIAIDGEGANIIYTHPGANATITPSDLDDLVSRALISEAGVVTIMDPPLETAIRMAETAKGLRKVVVWDPGMNSELGIENVRALMKNVDYLVANEHEVANLTAVRNPLTAAKKLAATNKRLKAVVRLGAKGCVMYDGESKKVSPNLDLSAVGLKVVNTVGCGDAFLGAFVAALSEGLPDIDALKWGNCAGGLKATRFETRGSPTREMLMKYLT
ncbi:MAG TPA: PfkB family carbohydrate kinase [Candidatus Dormibacteraeota bacterium]|nr:PfkB family carbohydrate kinase [Candidatus Dormibacteraeota bacterium]